jgi:DNA-binding transcriptional MerR regulator
MQNLHKEEDPQLAARHRIGTVSRLAGVPVTTLRVWETRYDAFLTGKSEGGHRLYSEGDVIKARLMRQLAEAGHRVGGIANLSVDELQQLLGATRAATDPQGTAAEPARPLSAAIVGEGIAARIHAPAWTHRWLGAGLDVRHVHPSLAAIEAASVSRDGVDLLLVQLNAIHLQTPSQLARAVSLLQARRVIVLYNYGADAAVEALRNGGMLVRREPLHDAELAELIRSVVIVDAPGTIGAAGHGLLIPPRKFSDAVLARVAASPTSILCECPRHIAELIAQLAAFEAYSQQCLNQSEEDARVHAQLRATAGSARALFENALEMVAAHGGVALPAD